MRATVGRITPWAALALAAAACAPVPGQEVPYVQTPHHVVEAMLKLADVTKDDVVYDLGSGDGRIVIAAARDFGARGVGIEIDPRLVAESNRWAMRDRVADRVRFVQQDLFQTDLTPATVLTLYITRELNLRLRPKILHQLRPGARVVSHRFDMGDWAPDREVRIDVNGSQETLYLWVIPAAAQSVKLDDATIRAEVEKIRQPGMMNVPRADGEFLHDLVVGRGYRRGLEIGTSNGYSAVWIALGLRKTGGRLITLEIDARRADLAAENFKRLGLLPYVELRRGDALKLIPTIEGPFDFVFIDAWKEDYAKYFEQVFPKVRSGGAILAHNVLSHAPELQAFLEMIQKHPQLETHIDRRSPAGISVSVKK
jgi:predicted O-methyltransferase YrrM